MRRISSRFTYFYKRVFPALWFGFLAVFIAIPIVGSWTGSTESQWSLAPAFVMPAFMAVFGYVLMKKLIFDLVDDVFEDGDTLVVKNRGRDDRIALADIKNVNYSPLMSPPRVTLSLRKNSVFGDKVTFCGPIQMMPFAAHPTINELIERVDAAREGRRMG
jgi:hypothetical protein